MDKKLEKIFNLALEKIRKHQTMEFLVFPCRLSKPSEIKEETKPFARLDGENNYIEFNEEYRKTAHLIKDFRPLLNYIKRKKYPTNLD